MSKIAIYIIIGVVALIALCVLVHFIYRHYRIKYDLNIYLGGTGMLITIAAAVGGVLLLTKTDAKILGVPLLAVAVVFLLWTAIVTFKHCGVAGILAILVETVMCVPCLLMIFEFFSNHGRVSNYGARNYREERDIRERRDDYLEKKNGRRNDDRY